MRESDLPARDVSIGFLEMATYRVRLAAYRMRGGLYERLRNGRGRWRRAAVRVGLPGAPPLPPWLDQEGLTIETEKGR